MIHDPRELFRCDVVRMHGVAGGNRVHDGAGRPLTTLVACTCAILYIADHRRCSSLALI